MFQYSHNVCTAQTRTERTEKHYVHYCSTYANDIGGDGGGDDAGIINAYDYMFICSTVIEMVNMGAGCNECNTYGSYGCCEH